MTKKTKILISFLFLIAVLLIAINLVEQRQELRRGAAGGEGQVDFRLSLVDQPRERGEEFTVQVNLVSSSAQGIRVAGADLEFDPAVLEISEVNCDSQFPAAGPENGVDGNKINLTCYRYQENTGPQPALIIAPGEPLALGSFKVKVKTDAVLGETLLEFTRSRVPNENGSLDISLSGQGGTITVADLPTAAPSPTLTLAPTFTPTPTLAPTATPTPTLIPTPTSTPSPTPVPLGCEEPCISTAQCESGLTCTTNNNQFESRLCWGEACESSQECSCQTTFGQTAKARGDGNCDNKTDILDFDLWFNAFIRGSSSAQSMADFSCNGRVSIDDFEIWRAHFEF
ncbi:MAG: cohesin domain-containing protein [Candidatus Shapirobacteria bacterium]